MFGRELGKDQQFTDNPNDILPFIKECTLEKKPAFISVNPRVMHDKVLGIEKLFFDFDYADKTFIKKMKKENKTEEELQIILERRKVEMRNEVKIFLAQLSKFHITPLVLQTRKGFHVHIYFDKIYSLHEDNDELMKETYRQLQLVFLTNNKHDYKYMDTSVLGDFKRLCRIPLSVHEATGEECLLVKRIEDNGKIEYDKLRSIEYYKQQGIKEDSWTRAMRIAFDKIQREKEERLEAEQEHKDNWEFQHGFVGEIRPCFKNGIESGEMCHQMRLALLIEAYWAGHKTQEAMMNVFRVFNDFDANTCCTQVEWFWKNKVPEIEKSGKWKPYRCTTIEDLNWCLKSQCPIYIKRKQYGK